jgi:myosin heavy subunit
LGITVEEALAPHIYGLAANAYRQLWENKKNQAIVISGESGAGKTENTKFAMNFLTQLSHSETEGIEQ